MTKFHYYNLKYRVYVRTYSISGENGQYGFKDAQSRYFRKKLET